MDRLKKVFLKFASKGWLNWMRDKEYISLMYRANMGEKINLDNPRTFNEKIQWLKLYDRNPEYIKMADKYKVKKYVADIIGEEYIIPTLGVYDKFDDIDFEKLPNQFVLKCTHDSGGNVICKDKKEFNIDKAKEKINKSMKKNYFYWGREWPYKMVKPRIIAEQYMEDKVDGELRDYKFFCFDGEPKVMFVATDRGKGETKFDFFDLEFNHLDIEQHYPNSKEKIRKPKEFEKMIELSKKISKNLKHARVDFYEVNGNVYFGEITFYHLSGFQPFSPKEWDIIFGNWIDLQSKKERENNEK